LNPLVKHRPGPLAEGWPDTPDIQPFASGAGGARWIIGEWLPCLGGPRQDGMYR
jgi:hypothetical protein